MKSKLLLIDDDDANHLLYRHMIERRLPECDLYVAGTAEEGMALAREILPDCALLDVLLGDANGIDLCREFKQHEVTAHFPVLLITGMAMNDELRINGMEAGADDFLQRPCEEVDLVMKIRAMLRIKHAEDELRAVNKRLAELAVDRSKALHEYDERYRLLFDACSDAVLVFELKEDIGIARFVEVNESGCRLFGYSREEMFQLRMKDLIPPDRYAGIQGRIESILKHQQAYFETTLLRRNEHPFPVALRAQVFEREEGHAIVTIVRDLSHASVPGEADRDYRVLAAHTGQMIYDCDLRKGDFTWGGAVTQVTGYGMEEMGSFSWYQLINAVHPDDQRKVLRTFRDALDAVSTYQVEFRIRHRSGEYRHVENMGVVLPGEDGRAYRILGTIKDISMRVYAEEERQQLERQMQHSQRMESLGVLAGGIAHDFNNILTAIIGLTDMALQDIPDDSPTHKDIKESLQAAHRAKELVKQILMFSRQSSEERAPLLLHIVVREALKLLRASLPPTIEIIDSVDVNSGAVFANAAQMHQVVMNYCTNAAQAMGNAEGRLEVRLSDIEVDESLAAIHPRLHPGPYVVLRVMDTGHGMEPHVMTRIFDPFFTTKGPGEGTGMGLAVVHGIVTSHGGAIVVNSVPGKGTTFHTYLPRVVGGVMPEEVKTEPLPGGSESILFVDDEEMVLRFGEALLPRLGYHMTFFTNGVDALKAFQKMPAEFDLVITDQMMPKMTGAALAEAIHAIRPEIPVILFTGFSDQYTDAEIRSLGIQDVVLKPVIGADLACTIRSVLDLSAGGMS